MQKHRLLEQALPSLFPFSLPSPPPLFAPATQASSVWTDRREPCERGCLPSLYVCVWLVNTLTSTAPIRSPIICMWSPADICEQWERNLSFSSADVRGPGLRDEPLRTSAWEAKRFPAKWTNRSLQPRLITSYIFQAVTTYRVSSDRYMYLPHRKLYIRNSQPINNNTSHTPNSSSTKNQVDEEPLCGSATSKSLFIYLFIYLIDGTTYILFLNTLVTLGVP